VISVTLNVMGMDWKFDKYGIKCYDK